MGAASVFTTLFSAGLAFVWGGLLALPALWLGRVAGRRSAELLAWAGLGLACVGCAAWTLLF